MAVMLVVVFVVVNTHLFSLPKDSGSFAISLLNKRSGEMSVVMKSGYPDSTF